MTWKDENFLSDLLRDRRREREVETKERISAGIDYALYHKCGQMLDDVDPHSFEEKVCKGCKQVIHDFDCHEIFL